MLWKQFPLFATNTGSAPPSDRTTRKEIARVHRPSVSALLVINKQHRLPVSDLIVLSARSKEGKCGVGSPLSPCIEVVRFVILDSVYVLPSSDVAPIWRPITLPYFQFTCWHAPAPGHEIRTTSCLFLTLSHFKIEQSQLLWRSSEYSVDGRLCTT